MCCCQIPPYDDLRCRPTKSIGGNGVAIRAWLSFAAGVVLLTFSLASAAWLVSRLA